MVGEDVELLVRPGSDDEMMPYERLLSNIEAILCCSFVRTA